MARDAIARLYDVDADSFGFKKLRQSKKYDQGTVTFRAKKGKLIDLGKLHESIWATRLSGGTNSGVICLQVTAVGEARTHEGETTLDVAGTNDQIILVDDVAAKPRDAEESALDQLHLALKRGEKVVSVTGYVDGWVGRWPKVLSKPPSRRPRLMVTSFETETNL